jgi:ariadne-1
MATRKQCLKIINGVYLRLHSTVAHLFEAVYSDLERAVEDLSELLEQPIESEYIPVLRQKVTDKSVYVQKRNEILLEDTAKGYLEERWKWNDVVIDTL